MRKLKAEMRSEKDTISVSRKAKRPGETTLIIKQSFS